MIVMPQYETLKRAAGSHNFGPGETIDLPSDEAKALLADNAIRLVGKPDDEEEKKTTKKS